MKKKQQDKKQQQDEDAKLALEELDKLAWRLENTGLSDYIRLSRNLPKVLWLNFLSGVARGLGFTVGTTIVLAIAYKIVSQVISYNIPYITDALLNFVNLIQNGNGL